MSEKSAKKYVILLKCKNVNLEWDTEQAGKNLKIRNGDSKNK